MNKKKDSHLKVNNNLIMLERGDDELLLVDPCTVQPLYIKRGRDYFKGLISETIRRGSQEGLEGALSCEGDLLDTLIKHRILLQEDQDPASNDPGPSNEAEKTSGLSLYLLLSHSCNLGCVYCLNGKKTYRSGSNLKMGEEVAFQSVEKFLDRLEQGGYLEIVFFGGEPLLNWPMVKKVIQYCEDELKPKHKDKRIKYHMTSNLSILPEDLVEWAAKYDLSILCDVDGEAEIHDKCRPYKDGRRSHAAITDNIGKLIQAGLDISLRATITSLNQHKMMEIANHHKSLGARGCALVPLSPVNSDEELLDKNLIPDASMLIQGLEGVYRSRVWDSERLFPFSVYSSKVKPGTRITMGCGAPYGNTPVVDAKGDVYPCIYLVGIKRFYLGNVLEEECVDQTLLARMQSQLYVDNLDECRDCQWRYLCGGGCPVTRLTVLNNPDCTLKVRDYCAKINCEYTKKILELLYWELAEEASTTWEAEAGANSSVALDSAHTVYC